MSSESRNPGNFPEDRTREPYYGIVIEFAENYQGTNACVHWLEAEEMFWHEEDDLEVVSEPKN